MLRISRSLSLVAPALTMAAVVAWPAAAADRTVVRPVASLTATASAGPTAWFVELEEPAAAVAWAEVVEEAAPAEARTHGVVARARAAAEGRLQSIAAAQAAVAPRLARLGAREIYRVRRALNGIAVLATPEQAAAFRRVQGVKAVRPIEPEVLHNRTSVPFIGAPALWQSTTPVPAGLKGQDMRIGIIDTGIDYLHGGFGGSGVLADYQQAATDSAGWTANPRSGPGRFPTAKVVGGWDFAGDNYSAGLGTPPAPDPNPMDCNGHGSHVAGTAAGFGVTAAGTTYTGAYNATDPYSTAPRIGPGVAPEAKLYALRVFGCGGSTALTAEAIDWAIDPNGDGDFSDRLDVINMSLGSSFGNPNDITAEASDNAARAGVIVVASAGNSGDTYFVSGSPASAGRSIAVANTTDAGSGAFLRVNSPASLAGDYVAATAAFGPSLADGAVTGDIVLVNDGSGTVTDGCQALVGFTAGAVALVDRGTCTFKTKTLNAQNAGAIAVIVANNVAGNPPVLGDDATIVTPITIPTISVSQATGVAIKAALVSETVNASLLSGGDSIESSSSRGPRNAVPIRLKPDLAAPGTNIPSVQAGRVCTAPSTGCIVSNPTGYIAGNASLTITGTSMSAPHVSGLMALLRQLHPDWTVEQLKALVMNYSLHDVFQFAGGIGQKIGIGRVGAGRVDAASAGAGTLIAFAGDDRGAVSLSFDGEVAGVVHQTRTVHVLNFGTSAATLDVGFVSSVDAPGVSFSVVGPPSVTVPAEGYASFDVLMTADASQMDFSADPSVAATQGGIPRFRLSEEAAYLTFTPGAAAMVLNNGGGPLLRLPVYAALRPVSASEATGPIATGGAATGTGVVTLAGTGLCTGTVSSGACTGTFPTDRASLVSAFELQGVSGKDPSLTETGLASSDLKYAGVQYDSASGLLIFAVATWESWATPAAAAFNIIVDGNNDGTDEKVLMNRRFSSGSPPMPTDLFFGATGNYAAGATVTANFYVNLLSPASIDTSLWGSNVLMLAATPAQLGVTVGQPFRWRVVACPGFSAFCGFPPAPDPVDSLGPFTWSTAAQGLDFNGMWAMDDQPGNTLPVTWNTANFAANGTQGALLIHHHNGEGTRAEPVLVQTDPVALPSSADLAVTLSLPVTLIQTATTATMAVTVSNAGPTAASGLAVHVPLPRGLAYVSHAGTGTGTYDPVAGVWSVGALATSAAQSLTVTFEGRQSGRYLLLAEVAAATPLDPRQANNRAVAALTVREIGEVAPGGFFTVAACRLVDTRSAPNGTYAGPALAARADRVFPVAGQCGVPPTAKAVAVNVTVTGATGGGFLRAFAAFPASVPNTSVLNFNVGATRANNAIVGLSPDGQITVFNGMASGTAHLVLDVVGYFE